MSDLIEELLKTPQKRPAPPSTIRPFIELLALPTPQDWEARQTFDEETKVAEETFRASHKRGLTKAELNIELSAPDDIVNVVAEKLCAHPRMPDYLDAWHRIGWQMRAKNWLKPLDKDVLVRWLKEKGQELRLFELAKFCTFAEICRFAHELEYDGELVTSLHEHPFYKFVDKIAISAEHWGDKQLPWDELVKFHRLLMNFEIGLPGFEVTFDFTMLYHHSRGWAEFTGARQNGPDDPKTKPWLDGEIGLIISFNGEHVMTVGVSPSNRGLLVNQIQLLKNKGNRWLYKLPAPHFEFVLQRLLAACKSEDIGLYLVKGESLRNHVKSLYKELALSQEAGEHIRSVYNQRLVTLSRSQSTTTVNGLEYRQLHRK